MGDAGGASLGEGNQNNSLRKQRSSIQKQRANKQIKVAAGSPTPPVVKEYLELRVAKGSVEFKFAYTSGVKRQTVKVPVTFYSLRFPSLEFGLVVASRQKWLWPTPPSSHLLPARVRIED